MSDPFRRQLSSLWPAWVVAQLAPSALLLSGHSSESRRYAVVCFLLASMGLVAHAFHRNGEAGNDPATAKDPAAARLVWRGRMLALGLTLLASHAVFLLLCLGFNDPRDFVRPIQAFTAIIPALCLTPLLALTAQNRLAGVVLSVGLVFGAKLVAGAATCLVYGWDASEQGRTTMPWENPDFLLWVFWIVNALLAAIFYRLGARRFCEQQPANPSPGGTPPPSSGSLVTGSFPSPNQTPST